MSGEYKYKDLHFKLATFRTDEGNVHRTVSVFVDDEEVVYGAPTLEEAVALFDVNYKGD